MFMNIVLVSSQCFLTGGFGGCRQDMALLFVVYYSPPPWPCLLSAATPVAASSLRLGPGEHQCVLINAPACFPFP